MLNQHYKNVPKITSQFRQYADEDAQEFCLLCNNPKVVLNGL